MTKYITLPLLRNFSPGRLGRPIKGIVIHVTDGPNANGTLAWFNNPIAKVSAHYLVDKDGQTIWNLVKDEDTAWHAGLTAKDAHQLSVDRPDLYEVFGPYTNLSSIGIEHVGRGADPWSPGMVASSVDLVVSLCRKHNIPIDRKHIVGHRELYPKKPCPGKGDVDLIVRVASAVHELNPVVG